MTREAEDLNARLLSQGSLIDIQRGGSLGWIATRGQLTAEGRTPKAASDALFEVWESNLQKETGR